MEKTQVRSTSKLNPLLEQALLSEETLIVGCGEGGCNVAKEIFDLGYQAYFINSAREDMDSLDVPSDLKFQLPNSRGCNKNNTLGKQLAAKHYPLICRNIATKFSNSRDFYFCCSMGGGTGPAIAVMVIRALSKLLESPDIQYHFHVLAIFPNLKEKSLDLKKNTAIFYNDLVKLDCISSIYVINNDAYDEEYPKVNINKAVAAKFFDVLNLARSNSRSNVDMEEVQSYTHVKGVVTVGDIIKDDSLPSKYKVEFPECFVPPVKGGDNNHYIYSFCDSTDSKLKVAAVESALGAPVEGSLIGWNNSRDYVVAFGLPFPAEYIQQDLKSYQDMKNQIGTGIGSGLDVIDLSVLDDPKPKDVAKEEAKDLSDLKQEPTGKDAVKSLFGDLMG